LTYASADNTEAAISELLRGLRGLWTKLSIQGTIQNTGDPAVTVLVITGALSEGRPE